MAVALVVLAIGSALAGYVGVPHALGGHNALGEWLHPSFTATARALVSTPAVLTRARTLGLGAVKAKESWQAVEGVGGDRWNQNMAFLYGTPTRNKGLDVHMTLHDGHWRIEGIGSRPPARPAPPVPPSTGPGR